MSGENRYLLVPEMYEKSPKWPILWELLSDYQSVFGKSAYTVVFPDNHLGIELIMPNEREYEKFLQYIYEERGSIYYPEKLGWLPVSKEEWDKGLVPDRETPIYKEGNIVDKYGLTWYPERVEKYRKKYKGYRIKNFSRYRESLDGEDLLVTTEDGIEEIDPITVKFPYYANK